MVFYVAGNRTTIWLLLRRTLQRLVILFDICNWQQQTGNNQNGVLCMHCLLSIAYSNSK